MYPLKNISSEIDWGKRLKSVAERSMKGRYTAEDSIP
jgi:hypothetical protein